MSAHGIGLASAFRTLTILPFPGRECKNTATTLYWFPVVGVVLGFAIYIAGSVATNISTPLLGASIATGLLAYLTRAFHLDGLADMADGFGGGWDRERILEIMKDSHVGVFGVIAVTMSLIIKLAALSAILEAGRGVSVIEIIILSRVLVVLQAVANPYARSQAGTAGQLVRDAKIRHALAVIAQALLYLFFVSSLEPQVIALVFGGGLLVTLYLGWRSRVKIGGVTGDVLGATVESGETMMLVVLALAVHLS